MGINNGNGVIPMIISINGIRLFFPVKDGKAVLIREVSLFQRLICKIRNCPDYVLEKSQVNTL